ncbi:MAG: hypothetical protein QGD89_03645 [Actinomycetota bacterium]|nr:hypothetical protein [Actinomycetota bacterium]
MLRKGTRVVRLTKKVGQVAATGTVIEIRDRHCVEVRWDDDHTSIISKSALTLLTEANRPRRGT